MQTKKLLSLLLVGMILLVGCTQSATPAYPVNPEPPETSTWISPGKVVISNFYPGARAEWSLTIHNGKDIPADFMVSYRTPDYTNNGFDKAPNGTQGWVIVTDSNPTLISRETRDVLVVLDVPANVTITSDRWEFWIAVKDVSQAGMIQTELCSRWMVEMR